MGTRYVILAHCLRPDERVGTLSPSAGRRVEPALAQQVVQGKALEDLFETSATLGDRRRSATGRRSRAGPGTGGAPRGGRADWPSRSGQDDHAREISGPYGLTSRRPAQILSIDVNRIAPPISCGRWLRFWAWLATSSRPRALAQAIEEHRHKDFVFIDTPGMRARDGRGSRTRRVDRRHPEIDTHLCARSMRPLDLARTIDRYEMFSPHKLIFTKLDETESFGPLINESFRRSLPFRSFDGQNIRTIWSPPRNRRLPNAYADANAQRGSAA